MRQAKPVRREDEVDIEVLEAAQREAMPDWTRVTITQNRVLRCVRATATVKRTQEVDRPCYLAPKYPYRGS